MLLDVSDGGTNTSKFGHPVNGLYRVFQNSQQTVFTHSKELVKGITADRTALLPPRPTHVPLISPESASATDFKKINLEVTTWFFYEIVDQCFKEDSWSEFLLTLPRRLATTYWKKSFWTILLVYLEQCRTSTSNHQKWAPIKPKETTSTNISQPGNEQLHNALNTFFTYIPQIDTGLWDTTQPFRAWVR